MDDQTFKDAAVYGIGIEKDGKRIPLDQFYKLPHESRKPVVVVIALVVILLLLLLGIIAAWYNMYDYHKREEILSVKDKTIIQDTLFKKKAGDCVLIREKYGYSCTEINTGKVFKIKL